MRNATDSRVFERAMQEAKEGRISVEQTMELIESAAKSGRDITEKEMALIGAFHSKFSNPQIKRLRALAARSKRTCGGAWGFIYSYIKLVQTLRPVWK